MARGSIKLDSITCPFCGNTDKFWIGFTLLTSGVEVSFTSGFIKLDQMDLYEVYCSHCGKEVPFDVREEPKKEE